MYHEKNLFYSECCKNERAAFTFAENVNLRKVLMGSSVLSDTYKQMRISTSTRTKVVVGNTLRSLNGPLCKRDIGLIQKFGLGVREAIQDQMNKGHVCTGQRPDDRLARIRDHRYWISCFKQRQREVYEVYRTYLRSPFDPNTPKPPAILWLNGGAGYGKSELLRQIIVLCELKNRKCIRTAFNHINAMHIGGVTSWSMLHFSEKDMDRHMNFTKAKWWTDFTDMMNDAVLIVIDEFSNQAPWHLAKLSKACEAFTGKFNVPFGGIPVIMCGDLGQLGPVRAGRSLASAIVDMCLNVWTMPYTMLNPLS